MPEMMMNPSQLFNGGDPLVSCQEKITFHDKGKGPSTYIAINSKKRKICKFHIDGGLIREKEKRCDYGLWVEDNRMFLIELKGCDVDKSFKQILNTYRFFQRQKQFANMKFNYHFRIIPTKCSVPDLRQKTKNLQKKLGCDLLIRNIYFREDIH